MTKLADLLRGRLIADPRALIGALEISHDRILLNFGAIGELPRIVLGIEDNAVTVLAPEVEADAPAQGDDFAAKLKAAEEEIVTLKGTIELLSKPPAEKTAVESPAPAAATAVAGDGGEGTGGASGAPEQPAVIDPKAHNLAALKAMAEKAGVAVAADATKKQIADALNAAAAK